MKTICLLKSKDNIKDYYIEINENKNCTEEKFIVEMICEEVTGKTTVTADKHCKPEDRKTYKNLDILKNREQIKSLWFNKLDGEDHAKANMEQFSIKTDKKEVIDKFFDIYSHILRENGGYKVKFSNKIFRTHEDHGKLFQPIDTIEQLINDFIIEKL